MILVFGAVLVYLCGQILYELIINADNILEIKTYGQNKSPVVLLASFAGSFGGIILGIAIVMSSIRTLKSNVVIRIDADGYYDKRYLKEPLPWSKIDKVEFLKIGSANFFSHAKFKIYAMDVELYMTSSATLITSTLLQREMDTLDIGALDFENKEFGEALSQYVELIEV